MITQPDRRILVILSVLILLAAACSMPALAPKATPGQAPTKAVSTIDAMMTEIAGSAITNTPAVITNPTNPPATPTTRASFTPVPTATRVILATSTATQVCDLAGFVADISVPDGSIITASTPFFKTWRLKNLGACTWTADYAVIYDSGDNMGAATSQKLGASVPPGQTMDVTIPMKAPGTPGAYRGYWRMRNAAGALFGLGGNDDTFYVDIKVVAAPASGSGYDFSANLCLAQWTGNSNNLPCIGKDNTTAGFVLYKAHPTLESGYLDDEPALLTNPPYVADGIIRGKYPAYTVKNGDHFLSIVGCEYNAKNCNVRFQLDYQIDNGSIQTLASWNERYEGATTTIDLDLSSLAGKNVSFILTVQANGASDQDRAQWLLPRIAQPAATPTLTPTPTPTVTPTKAGYPAP